jgi:hypothetical protein
VIVMAVARRRKMLDGDVGMLECVMRALRMAITWCISWTTEGVLAAGMEEHGVARRPEWTLAEGPCGAAEVSSAGISPSS